MTRAVYLGDAGTVEIQRHSPQRVLTSELTPADVNVSRKRFSMDIDPSTFITGDRIEIRTQDGSALGLISGSTAPDWTGYIHTDDAGGLRLYTNYVDAVNGEFDPALVLTAPSGTKRIEFEFVNDRFRYLAKVASYQFTTSRETVDLTELGEEHRRSFKAGLISGQGQLTCFWDYAYELCDGTNIQQNEYANYLAGLVLRTRAGAGFEARFYLNQDDEKMVWWECPTCIVTNVGMGFTPGQPIQATIDFITSGKMRLRIGAPPAALRQENSDFILQESGERLYLEDD